MRTPLYRKVGRRYVEVGELDQGDFSMLRMGHTLVSKQPGQESRLHPVDPDYAAVEAVLKECGDQMVEALQEAAEFKPKPMGAARPLTELERKAWEAYVTVLGGPEKSHLWLVAEGAHGVVAAALQVVREGLSKRTTASPPPFNVVPADERVVDEAVRHSRKPQAKKPLPRRKKR